MKEDQSRSMVVSQGGHEVAATCFHPGRENILRELNFQSDLLCNIYQIGSRVYGTFRCDSDFDFFMVVSDEYYERLNENYLMEANARHHHKFNDSWVVYSNQCNVELTKKNEEGSEWSREGKLSGMGREFQCLSIETLCGAELNINLYNYTSFKNRLQSNWIQSIICYSMIEQHVPSLDFPELHNCFKFYFRKVALSAISEASTHYRLAKKYWDNSNTYRSKKYIVHTFRDLLFAIQIVKFRRIVDFSESNDLYYEIMRKEETDWSHYNGIYYERYQKLKEELNELVMLPPKLKEILQNSQKRIIQSYCFAMKNDLKSISEELESYFSFDILQQYENGVEYLFIRGTDETPLYSQFTLKLFNGCLIANSDNIVEILCLSHIKEIPVANRYLPKLDIKKGCDIWKIDANENVKTILIHLYFDKTCWKIFSSNILDELMLSSEKIFQRFEEIGHPLPENENFTYTFELLLNSETVCIEQMNLFSIQDRTLEAMVEFTGLNYPTKRVRFDTLTSMAHVLNYAKQLNPLETKELLIFDSTSIVSVSLFS